MVAGPSVPFQVNGFYTQPYNELVQPERVWRVPKYFLRRWTPYLTPSRFWAVVAARQFAYWNDKAKWFTVYDKRFAQEACLSTIHFRRVKAEMAVADQPLSLFLAKEELAEKDRYHVINGQTKPKPTTYYVRLDDPLTPADSHHLSIWFQSQNQQRRAEAVVDLLQTARELPRKDLLAPSLTPYLVDLPAQFRYQSVLDVIGHLYGSKIAQNEQVKQEADTLHTHLTGLDYYGKEYFRVQWLEILKSGPAFLLTYLRSLCFHDEQSGELRNEVTFTRPDLADNLGITTRTLVNWLGKLEKAVPTQPLSSFVTLLEQQRSSSNEVVYTYRIEMLEPLTAADLPAYKEKIKALQLTSELPPHGKNDNHDPGSGKMADGKNDDHDSTADGKKDSHETIATGEGDGKNDNHDPGLMEKMSTPKRNIDEGLWKKRWPFKYYQTLIQSVTDEDITTLAAADWPSQWKTKNAQALLPFACAACDNEYHKLFDLLGIDKGGPSRKRILAGGLGIEEMVAWYLYAADQEGLSKPPVNMTIARVQQGLPPPENFLNLARLSWEVWRCYACLLVLDPGERDKFCQGPAYDVWMNHYGHFRPEALPFQVGVGVSETMNKLAYGGEGRAVHSALQMPAAPAAAAARPEASFDRLWRPVLREVKGAMTSATFNTWLKDTVLVVVEEDKGEGGQQWVVGVKGKYAQDWLTHRLNTAVIEPVATAVQGTPVTIRYVCLDGGNE